MNENLMVIEFTTSFGEEMVALFNALTIEEEDVRKYIIEAHNFYNSKVIIMTKEQYSNLCTK